MRRLHYYLLPPTGLRDRVGRTIPVLLWDSGVDPEELAPPNTIARRHGIRPSALQVPRVLSKCPPR